MTTPHFTAPVDARSTEDHVNEEERLTTVLDDELYKRADRIHDHFPHTTSDLSYGHALHMAANAATRA